MLYYMDLEKYESRYTAQLTEWNTKVFKRREVPYQVISGNNLTTDEQIVTGQVLDAHGRCFYSLTQMSKLVHLMKEGQVTNQDVLYFEDMFTPGMSSLPYIIQQSPEQYRPKIFVRCLAQTIDPDDFLHVWGMNKWMGHFEKMLNQFVTGILASNEEMVAHMRIAGWEAPIYNISGLAFGKEEVLERVNNKVTPFQNRPFRIVFASRWDQEKNPNFYMDLIEMFHRSNPDNSVEFCILSGGKLRSNNQIYITRAKALEKEGKLTIFENLKKNQYYDILNHSRVMVNTAHQDWVSNTVSEADTLGCNVLFPAYRSFPETFSNDPSRMYIPWSLPDVYYKLLLSLESPNPNMGLISNWTNGTIDRILDIIQGKGEQWSRNNPAYREHALESKYKLNYGGIDG